MSRVLVTGGSGFLAGHVLVHLLLAGHEVKATLRDPLRAEEVRANVRAGGADPAPLAFVEADLATDAGWPEAVAGCEFVLHLASPFPSTSPKHEDELIRPAREGAVRVLRAARDAGVKRVVLTSSFAAVGYGQARHEAPFTEADWTDTTGNDVSAYIKSKALAERAAWDFLAREGGRLELTVINPVGIFGPVLGTDVPSSVQIVLRMLEGQMPATPNVHFGVVDVRDVADLHLRAMTDPSAKGERFLAVAGEPMSMHEVARVLREQLGPAGAAAPTRRMPDVIVRMLALFMPAMRELTPQLGVVRRASNEKARQVLGWAPRPNAEVITSTGEALLSLALIKSRKAAQER